MSLALSSLVDRMHRGLKDPHGEPTEHPRKPMEEMTKPTDPHAILDAIKEKHGAS